jgi:PRC-barrel domain
MEVVMSLPDPKQVRSWGGKLLVDREGNPVGTVTQVYTDDDTGLPEWATTNIGEATVFIPLKDAVERDGRIHVLVHRDDVARAPLVVDRRHITPDEEARLYRHYGIPYSPDRSRSGLPVGEGPVPTRLQILTASARAAAADAGRRLSDPPTLVLTALAGVLALLVWATLRRAASDGD